MGIFDRFGRNPRQKQDIPVGQVVKEFTDVDFFQTKTRSTPVYSPDSDTFNKLYSLVPTINRCVKVIAESIAALPIKIIDYTNEEDPIDISDYPEFKLFKTYNDSMTKYDFWKAALIYLELTGEMPMLKQYKGGKVTALYPFNPEYLIVNPWNEFAPASYNLVLMGRTIHAEVSDIFFPKYFNPDDPLRGLSPLKAAAREVTLDLNAVTSSINMFEQGGRPSGILSTEQPLNKEVFDRATEVMKRDLEGTRNHGKIGVVSHGFKFTPLSLTAKDAQLLEQRNFTKDSVREIFGVPPIYLQDYSDSSVLANADVQERLLWTATLVPIITMIEEMFNAYLMHEITNNLKARFEIDISGVEALQKDLTAAHKRWTEDVKNGVVTRNEMRISLLGLEAGDDPLMDVYTIPGRPLVAPEPVTDRVTEVANALRRFGGMSTKDINDSLTKTKAMIKKQDEEMIKARISRDVLKQADLIADDFESALVELFREQAAEVARGIDAQKNYKQTTEFTASLFDFNEWISKYRDVGQVYMSQALKEAITQWGLQNGEVIDLNIPGVGAYVNEQSLRYATIINDTTVKAMDDIIVAGLNQGKTITAIGDELAQYFSNAESYRAQTIARTEMTRAFNKGRVEANKASSQYENHMWLTSRDEKVRDTHVDADGQIVKVGDPFNVIDFDSTQADPTYPSGINERCTTIPTKDEPTV